MEQDIVYYHGELQNYIHMVERDETDTNALRGVRDNFLLVFEMLKRIMISRQERYYGLFLMNFELCVDFSSYYDAAISMDAFPFHMRINPLLLGLKSLPEMIYILCHEIEHIVLNHPVDGIKYNPQKDPGIAFRLNIAMDASINDRLTEDSRANRFDVIAQPRDAITSSYLRERYRIHVKELQAFDYYFERIPVPKDRGGGKRFLALFADDCQTDEIITEPKRKRRMCLPCWTACDDPDEAAGMIRRFVSEVCEGMSDAMREALPAHQKDALKKLLVPPTLTWQKLLKRYVGTIPHGHKKTRLRLNRRQPERYDISGSIQDRLVKIVVAIDTSGSMSKECLERIMVELFAIIGTRTCEVTVIECDAQIQHIYRANAVTDISYDIHGRGGTSYIPVIEHINSNRSFRDAILIYFTDGMGDQAIPRPLIRRTMWVLQDSRCKLSVSNPYGEVLIMD